MIFLSLKNDVNVPSKSNKHKNFREIKLFFVGVLKVTDKRAGSGAGPMSQKGTDPDP